MSKKISELDKFSGMVPSTANVAVSILGTTYRADPLQFETNKDVPQIHINASTTILPSWNGAIVIITAPGVVLTVPGNLPVITFKLLTRPTATCDFVITAPKVWVNGAPTLVPENSTAMFLVDNLNSNEIYVEVAKVTPPYFYKFRGATTVTGTTTETTVLVIPIGLVTVDTILKINDLIVTADFIGIVNPSGSTSIRLRISDSTSINITDNNLITTVDIPSNANSFSSWFKIEPTCLFESIGGSTTQYKLFKTAGNNNSTNPFGQLANNKFIHVTVQLPASANNITLRSCLINKL